MLDRLENSDFALLRSYRTETSTAEVAADLGTIVHLEKTAPSEQISTVQSLRPRNRHEVGDNRYSGNYGLDQFPLHTDLAHWAIPPRYVLLRSIVPAPRVATLVFSWTDLIPHLGTINMRKAVFAGRRQRVGYSGLVRALMISDGIEVRRWDAVFLMPLTEQARQLATLMTQPKWGKMATEIRLMSPGDTLIIDNWRALHGRSTVPIECAERRLERINMSEIAS